MIWVVESSSRELLCNSYGDLHRFTTFFWWDLPPSSKFGISLDPTLRMQPYTVLARSCSIHRCKMYHYINYIYIYIVYAHIKYTYHTSIYIYIYSYIHIYIYIYTYIDILIDRSWLTDWLIDYVITISGIISSFWQWDGTRPDVVRLRPDQLGLCRARNLQGSALLTVVASDISCIYI